MSDRDIGKLYIDITHGKEYISEKKMSDLYRDVINEATISIAYDDKSIPKQTFKMSDEIARTLGTHENKLQLPKLIEEWTKSGGWSSSTALKNVPAGIVSFLSDIFDLNSPEVVDNIISEIEQLLALKQSGSLNILSTAITKGSFNIVSELSTAHSNLPSISNPELLKRILTLSDFSEGNVGVGNGEVLITLFTEATNPDKGDLMLPTGEEIELKGEAGRPGKGDVVDRAVKFERHAMKNFNDFDENRKQNEIFLIKEPLKRDIEAIYPYYSEQKNVHTTLRDLHTRLSQSDCCDYEELLKMVQQVVKQLTNKAGYNKQVLDVIANDQKMGFVDDILNKFNHIKSTLNQRTKKPDGGAGYVASYLSKYGFGKFKADLNMQTDLAKDLSMMSGQPDQAKKAVLQIISDQISSGTLDTIHITNMSLRILSAIQIADYAVGEGFAYYLAMCERPGDVYSNAHAIGPFDNYINAVKDAFYVLMKTDASIGASTGGKAGESGRGGFTIKLNK